jgi:outer membrane protein TolC
MDSGSPHALASYQEENAPAVSEGQATESAHRALRNAEGRIPSDQRQLSLQPAEEIPAPAPDVEETEDAAVALNDIVASIHATFPLLQAAYQERGIAAGDWTAAWGAFDTKLKASTENQPLGFYETYRHAAGLSQPLYAGGELFGGYRIGRGDFEPWYLERQTDEGGEFKAGVRMPLSRDREIDARRAELWRANYDRQRAEPEIRLRLIQYVRDGSIAFWYWVAAGQQYRVGDRALQLAQQRNEQLERKVELGDVDPPVLQDNLRAIAQREAKLIDLKRKLQQAAIKLSLFYRSPDGTPLIPDDDQSSGFPNPAEVRTDQLNRDIAAAIRARPEMAALNLLAQRIDVDLREARNDMLPAIDAWVAGSQDVGPPTSSKGDKSQFEMEAGLFVDAALQRRKAQGKMQSARSKRAQLSAKRQFTENKIVIEIQSASAALNAAYQRLEKARESGRLAEYMADVERRRFDLGESDLLSVVLREQSAIEAAEAEIDALLEYFTAAADYDAALARDWPTRP